ncbi:MAG TPA: peptidylprolyl isomerase [Bacteroidales bacterium]|nr:peptidylprolyl isomerase [Bacteroidales bacterium]
MKKTFSILTFALLSLLAFAQDINQKPLTVLDEVVAVVGKNIILQSDIETQYMQHRMQGYVEGSSATIKCDILKELIFQKLLLNQADIDSIVVNSSSVNQELDRRFKYFISQFGSQEKLEEYYHKTVDQFKEEMREIIQDQLMQQEVQSAITKNVNITPKEIKAFFKEIPSDSLPLINTAYQVAEIVKKPPVSAAEKLAVKERLLGLRTRVLKGENFATLAILYSEDPGSSKKGGELGMYGRGELYPEFESVAFGLKEGEISGIVETEAGYHVIQMIERKDDFINVRHILLRPKISPIELQKAANFLDSIHGLILSDSISFADAARLFSDNQNRFNGGLIINPNSGNSKFQAEELDPKIFYVIDNMEIGQVSGSVSFTTEENMPAFRMLQLVDKTAPHKANMEQDYDVIQKATINKKKQQVIDQWVILRAAKTYIRINEKYNKCSYYETWQSK